MGIVEQLKELAEAQVRTPCEHGNHVLIEAADEITDWRESAERAAGEMCGDERHCTCVPLLRHELAEERECATKSQEMLSEEITDLRAKLAAAEELLSRVNDEEGYHLGGRLGSAVEAYCAAIDEAGEEG